MDEFEIEIIQKNLPELIKITNCNELLISELKSNNVLSVADAAELTSTVNWMERNKKLYAILPTRVNGFKHLTEGLAKPCQTGVLKLLGKSTDLAELPSPEPVFFNVLAPNILFTGRQEELQTLDQALQQPGSVTVISSQSCITGLGGIGKTDLARKLIQDICTNFAYIIWINAESDLSTSKDFKTLAMDKFGISIYSGPGREKDISVILDDVYTRLAFKASLVVFDNVENSEFVQKYFPKTLPVSSKIHILITSQDNDWGFMNQVSLRGLESDDAINFVKKGLQWPYMSGNEFDEDILEMVSRLQFFPLAIGQAIAFIRERKKIRKNYGPKEYIYDLDRNSEAILKKHGASILTGYRKGTYETVELTLNRLEKHENIGAVAIKLVKLMAYMSPDNIEYTLFDEMFDSFVLDDAILLLERFSVVSLISDKDESNPSKINIHRLVQHVMRCVLESEQQTETLLEEAILLLQTKMKASNVDHAMSIWHHVGKLKHILLNHHLFPEQIFWILLSNHRIVDALSFVNFALKTFSEHFDYAKHCEYFLKYEACVASVLDIQARKSECKNYVQNVLERALKHKSSTDQSILALRYFLVGLGEDYLNAMEDTLLELCELYGDWKRALGDEENFDSIRTLCRIGYQNHCLKKYEEAIVTYQKVCDSIEQLQILPNIAKRVHELDLKTIRLMAMSFAFMGKLDKALYEFECVLSKIQLPENERTHELIGLRHDFSFTLFYAGKFVRSLECSQFAYATYLKTFSHDHNVTMTIQFNIALAKSELGHDDAYKIALELYQHFGSTYGENSVRTLDCLALKGKILSGMGRHKEALQVFENIFNNSHFFDQTHILDSCLYKYYYVSSLVKSNQTDKAVTHLIPLREQVLPISDLLYIKPKVLKLYDELNNNA